MINLTGYLIGMAAGALIAAGWYFFAAGKRWKKGQALVLAAATLLFGTVLGAAGGRVGYLLLRIQMLRWDRLGEALLSDSIQEFSYYGGMAGVCLGAALAAVTARVPVRDALNTFAPAGALMAAAARFAEGALGMQGVGMYVEESFFPVAVSITWDGGWVEYYLAVFLYSGFFSLIACGLSLLHGKEEDRFRRTLFYLCMPQILFESMRIQSISWLFVRAEQLLCYLLCEGTLILYAVRSSRRGIRAWLPALAGLAVCGIVVAGEFAIDGKIGFEHFDIPPAAVYCVYAAALAGMAAAEHSGHRALRAAA